MARRYNLAHTSSLARSSREETEIEEITPTPSPAPVSIPTGLSLNQFYLAPGRAAKADYEAGFMTHSAFLNRVKTLRAEYDTLKALAAPRKAA